VRGSCASTPRTVFLVRRAGVIVVAALAQQALRKPVGQPDSGDAGFATA
jgi:hypothetical protein